MSTIQERGLQLAEYFEKKARRDAFVKTGRLLRGILIAGQKDNLLPLTKIIYYDTLPKRQEFTSATPVEIPLTDGTKLKIDRYEIRQFDHYEYIDGQPPQVGRHQQTIEGLGVSFSGSDRYMAPLFNDLNYEKGEGFLSRGAIEVEFRACKRFLFIDPSRDFNWNQMHNNDNAQIGKIALSIKKVFEQQRSRS